MKNTKKIIIVLIILITLVGCGKIPTLKNGEEKVASIENDGGVSADSLYKKLKAKYGAQEFVDLLDTEILNTMYEEDDEEKDYIKTQIDEIKSSAKENNISYSDLLAYYGFNDDNDVKEYLRLTYRREKAVNDSIEKKLKDSEIETYYKENIYGDIKAKHILISPDTSDDMTSEEKTKADNEAKKLAEEIIAKIKNGEDFAKLAEKYSDDTSTAKKGGELGWFSKGDMVEEFENAAFKLNKDEYTTSPVKTTYGYHIIYKQDTKDKPKLEDVKDEIIDTLIKEKLADDATLYYTTLEQIRKDAGLKFEDSELKKAYNDYIEKQKKQVSQK